MLGFALFMAKGYIKDKKTTKAHISVYQKDWHYLLYTQNNMHNILINYEDKLHFLHYKHIKMHSELWSNTRHTGRKCLLVAFMGNLQPLMIPPHYIWSVMTTLIVINYANIFNLPDARSFALKPWL